ncbi:MAG TPA: family 1 glycosylhydrolase, partial [Candidatus Saccharimonadia bacterium]|nr:family 1 glycosylhydrolase [Candidatus Saccharimonadia bacterium]
QLDFVGINYYFTRYITNFRQNNPDKPLNDMGWYMEPSGIEPAIKNIWRKYKKPIVISENGLADAKDIHRKWWLEENMHAISSALSDGADVIGYLHWSLLDNFEWAYGWWPKFGLISVDRGNMQRTVRESAKYYSELIHKSML